MRFNIEQEDFEFTIPLKEPTWSSKVPRWYQLDGPALALTNLFSKSPRKMDFLILASPQASNLTDWEFVQTGKIHAQKFVHTLPNIRASMALQVSDHACDFICLQKGPDTRSSAFREFFDSTRYKTSPALAIVDLLEIDETPEKRQWYRTTLISLSDKGDWECHPSKETSNSDFEKVWEQNLLLKNNSFQMGPWQWEKIN